MSKKTYRPYQPKQLYLLPPSLDEWLPESHVARFIDEVVDCMDLSEITRSYEKETRGAPPFHPAMMVKVLLYSYCSGVYSSRQIERRCIEDVATRYLAANNQPDFRTIAKFRKRHLMAIPGLFAQVLRLCREAGLVKLGHVALDGTKIKANASKHKAMSYGRMKTEEQRLEAEIQQMLHKAATIDHLEDQQYGDRRGDELPKELADRRARLEKIRAAKAALEAEARQHDGKDANPKPDGTPPGGGGGRKRRRKREPQVPEDTAQRNFTDPDSRIMLGSDKQFLQAYNAQAAVDHASQVIVAATVTNQAADAPHLIPMVTQVEQNLGRKPEELSADAGYFSEANVKWLLQERINPYIPPDKQRHAARRNVRSPRGPIPKGATLRDRMRRKLCMKRHAARYRLREQTVEPVFGQIKGARGFRQFSLRGLKAVQAEWLLICTVHNLLKLYGVRRAA